MGIVKREIEEDEERRNIALSLAVESGALSYCGMHDEMIFSGKNEIQEAYKMATSRFKKGKYNDSFKDHIELTDLIKEIYEDNCYWSICARCDEQMNSD